VAPGFYSPLTFATELAKGSRKLQAANQFKKPKINTTKFETDDINYVTRPN